MKIKHLVSGFVSILSLTVLNMVGCVAESVPEEDENWEEEDVGVAGDAIVVSDIVCEGKGGLTAGTYKLRTDVSGGNTTSSEAAYDIRNYCVNQINQRRTKSHASYDGLTLNPYHMPTNTNVLPPYTAATPGTEVNTTTEACRAIADAKAGGHSGYGNPLVVTNGSTAAFCPVGGSTVADAVTGCLNMIEKQTGLAGHQGGMLWDSARDISCALGVIKVPDPSKPGQTLTKKGIAIQWGQPSERSNLPNGSRCKANFYCQSGFCDTAQGGSGRCEGAAGSPCPASDNLDCTQHPEDPGVCVKRGNACQSGVCKSNNTCQ